MALNKEQDAVLLSVATMAEQRELDRVAAEILAEYCQAFLELAK